VGASLEHARLRAYIHSTLAHFLLPAGIRRALARQTMRRGKPMARSVLGGANELCCALRHRRAYSLLVARCVFSALGMFLVMATNLNRVCDATSRAGTTATMFALSFIGLHLYAQRTLCICNASFRARATSNILSRICFVLTNARSSAGQITRIMAFTRALAQHLRVARIARSLFASLAPRTHRLAIATMRSLSTRAAYRGIALRA